MIWVYMEVRDRRFEYIILGKMVFGSVILLDETVVVAVCHICKDTMS